jgi:RIO kinase 1
MRRMYHRCKLVHADLSEYNILYHNGHLYVIDVSQSVEHDHPHAFDFLRSDIKNVEEFFGRFGVKCLGLRRCFEFITRDRLEESGAQERDDECFQRWITETGESSEDLQDFAEGDMIWNAKSQTTHEDSVFLQSYIPRTLNEVYDPERDIDVLKGGEGRKLIYADTIGLVDSSLAGAKEHHVHLDGDESSESGVTESTSDEEAEEEQQGSERRAPRGHRHEDREAKKERKKAVKAEAREKRKNKMPKAEKKRRIKNTRP